MRLDEQTEGESERLNNSDSDVNSENDDDIDQIPEAAAQVITAWFKEHQGVCRTCTSKVGELC